MALETYELDKKMLEYSISQFRNIPEYVKMCEAFAIGLGTIQTSVDYLSDMIDLDKAEGIWLDYIAWLVGTKRSSYNITQYFCVNESHLNVEKYFYFEGVSTLDSGSLDDVYLRKRIKAKIAFNTSRATRNENIRIIEGMVNADKVIVQNARVYDNFTTIGSPTITDDGIASGFSSSNYLTNTPFSSIITTPERITFHLKGTYSSNANTANSIQVMFSTSISGIRPGVNTDGRLCCSDNSGGGSSRNHYSPSPVVQNNDTVEFDVSIKVNEYTVQGRVNGILRWNETFSGTYDFSQLSDAQTAISAGNNYYWTGSIDLKQFSIIVDGKTVYRPYREVPMLLDITIYGDNLFYPSTQALRQSIENVLGNGVGIRNLTII